MPAYQICFRIITLWTQHKFPDKSIQHVLQLVGLVGSIDNVTVILRIKLGLSPQLTTKKLGRIYLGRENEKKSKEVCDQG